MQRQEFPYFGPGLYELPLNLFVEQLGEGLVRLLEATDYTPYGKVLKPYSHWVDAGAVFLSRGRNLSAAADLLMVEFPTGHA